MSGTFGTSKWDSRRRAREAALQMLYQVEIGQLAVSDATQIHPSIGDADALKLDEQGRAVAERLTTGTWEDRERIDAYIADAARNWRIERLATIDRLLLRLAIHELLAHPATPPRVVMDEAIELARMYSGEDAVRFVNGVLDGVFQRLKEERKVVE